MPFSVFPKLKARAPWFIKIPAKIILSRMPIRTLLWQRLNLFKAGTMDDPASAFSLFEKHFEVAGIPDLIGKTALELGPGNSALTALFACALGAAHTWLIDAQELASQNLALFAQAEAMLAERGLRVPSISSSRSIDEALNRLDAEYLTDGLAALQRIPDREVDFLFSNAVLEHVRLAEFVPLARETHRILKPGGVASHQIDFRDHLQQGLNNLRFSERIWESDFMSRSGFYTNRLTWPTMRQIFEDVGFSVEIRELQLWPQGLPTSQQRMALPFKNMPLERLMTMGAHVVLRHG
jgi:SAM-dependent methyltransferase